MKPWQQSENTRSNFKVSIVLQLTILFTRGIHDANVYKMESKYTTYIVFHRCEASQVHVTLSQ